MKYYVCDGCGRRMERKDLRYKVKMDVRAAYDTLEISLADLLRDHRAELEALIERLEGMDPQQLEDDIYKQFKLDLCPQCHHSFIKSPLRFHPEAVVRDESEFDVDAFLRRLLDNQPGGQ